MATTGSTIVFHVSATPSEQDLGQAVEHIDQRHRGMLPVPAAYTAADAGLKRLLLEASDQTKAKADWEELRERLADIFDQYLVDRSNYDALRLPEVRKRTATLATAARKLKIAIAALPIGLKGALNTDTTMGLPAGKTHSANLQQIDDDLEMIIARAHSLLTGLENAVPPPQPDAGSGSEVEKPSRKRTGPPKMTHFRRLVHELIQLWIQTTGKPFPATVNETSRKSQQFVEEGPTFVLEMAKLIDPKVRFAAVRTAVREIVKSKSST